MKKTIWIIVIVAVLGGGYFFLGKTRVAEEGSTVKIGAILMLSGDFAMPGEASQKGIELAVKDINDSGGVLGKKLEVVYQDDKGDPKETVNAFYNLVNQKVRLIVGPNFTPAGSAVVPIIEKNNALLISPSLGSEKFIAQSKNAFNVWPPDRDISFRLAEYLFEKGYRKIAIFGSQQEWEKSQAEFVKQKFESLGGTITDFEIPLADNKDLRTEALKVKTSNPEAVVFTNYEETFIASVRLRELGVKSPFFSVLLDDHSITRSKGALEGTIFVTSYSPTKEFIDKYAKAYNMPPQFPADSAYDAAYLLAEAINKAGSTDTDAVVKVLAGIKEWKGASGDITFTSERYAVKMPKYNLVKGDSYVPVEN